MARWTIGRMMIGIAGIEVLLGIYVGLTYSWQGCTYVCTRTARCASNERNVALAILGYVNARGSFPSGTWPNPDLPPEKRLSWYVATSPYLDWPELDQAINKEESWDSPTNAHVAATRSSWMTCPNADRMVLRSDDRATAYVGIAGLGADAPTLPKGHPRAGIFGNDRQTTPAEITDGTSNTMMLAESSRLAPSWLAGGIATVRGLDRRDQPYFGPGRQFGGLHDRPGAPVAFADGSVRFISDTIDPKVFEAISTIAGGEKLPPDLFSP